MWEKIANVDRRVIYALMILVIALALLNPIGMAIVPSQATIDAYNYIEAMPNGSIVWLGMEFSSGGVTELIPAAQAIIRQGFKKDFKFVCAGMWQQAGDMAEMAFSIVEKEFPDKQYGVDWVNIGYKPGGEVLLPALINDVNEAAKGIDHRQNQLSSLPLMSQFKTIKDADLIIIFCTGTPGEQQYIKHVTGPLNIPLIESAISVSVPGIMPFVQSGQIKALIAGMKGAAEYEALVGVPGPAMAGMDAQSFSHGLILLFMILGNIGYYATRNKKG
ncbi:MAG TPA: hypothetical protein GXX23_04590 [Firmicutes bacterium]|nr:hypothetical protein [Candidatus Fermentithermobacillaceae bacterium]